MNNKNELTFYLFFQTKYISRVDATTFKRISPSAILYKVKKRP